MHLKITPLLINRLFHHVPVCFTYHKPTSLMILRYSGKDLSCLQICFSLVTQILTNLHISILLKLQNTLQSINTPAYRRALNELVWLLVKGTHTICSRIFFESVTEKPLSPRTNFDCETTRPACSSE